MLPINFFTTVLFAVFIWWFLTGLIFALYNRSDKIKRLGFIGLSCGFIVALWGVLVTRNSTDPRSIYLTLTSGVVIWGWLTAGYFLGVFTGPQPKSQWIKKPETLFGRFKIAIRAILFHELLVIGVGFILAALTWSKPNQWSFWVFITIWIMHSLAKINIFLGVRNFHIELMPEHMQHLALILQKRAVNPLFFPTIVFAVSLSLTLIYQGIIPQTSSGDTVGFIFLGTTVALGALEIILLVLPIPSMLWGWWIRAIPKQPREV